MPGRDGGGFYFDLCPRGRWCGCWWLAGDDVWHRRQYKWFDLHSFLVAVAGAIVVPSVLFSVTVGRVHEKLRGLPHGRRVAHRLVRRVPGRVEKRRQTAVEKPARIVFLGNVRERQALFFGHGVVAAFAVSRSAAATTTVLRRVIGKSCGKRGKPFIKIPGMPGVFLRFEITTYAFRGS